MTALRPILLLPTVVLVAACAEPSDAELLLPDVVEVAWERAYNAPEDGLGALVPVDVMVYDSASGEPLAGVELELAAEHDDTWVLPADAAVAVDPGATGVDGLLWDARRDAFFELELPAGDERVGTLSVETDADGVARAQLYVDAFPAHLDGDGFDTVSVVVSAASPEEPLEGTLLLSPR